MESTITRGAPRKSDICIQCQSPIPPKPGKRTRRCRLCETERVLISKWSKRSKEEIRLHIESLNKTSKLMEWIINNSGK